MAGIKTLFDEHDDETLEREWQGLFESYNMVLGALGSNGFEIKHIKVEQHRSRLSRDACRPEYPSITRFSRNNSSGTVHLARAAKRI